MSNKKYRLLKDLPGKPAGILLSYSATLKMYQYEGYPSVDMGDGYFVYGELPALVENNPDWFQEVVEPERVNISSFGRIFEAVKIGNGFSYGFYSNKEIFPSQYQAIKQAIEAALNGEVLYSIEDVRKALHGEWGTENAVGSVVNRLKNYKK